MLRREVLASLAALAATPSLALAEEPGLQLGDATPFGADTVRDQARALAAEAYAPRPLIPRNGAT